ncbi:MAG TPA: PD-(D/E)XK nuclease family protein [Thermodesulfovibrio thiophilus]|nr:PD-(D/E)XK nuclease family protein [Thermodesulfovibrio thiophilus]
MSLISKANAQKLKKQVTGEVSPRGLELAGALYNQFNEFHSKTHWDDPQIEELLVRQKVYEMDNEGWFDSNGTIMFSPSSASKCERELCLKAMKVQKDNKILLPFQQRWVRNSSAIHEAVQRDLLYMTKKMEDPPFKVLFNEEGLPMWEKNNAQYKEFEHNGVKFAIAGMMDGQLVYRDGSIIGFEFKTKSNSVAQVGHYKMKDVADYHRLQCVAYSLLFGLDEFIIMYEAVAKDQWFKGEDARIDIRTFYVNVTEQERNDLLDKFARVTKSVQNDELRPCEPDKCGFCEYKSICGCKGV